MDTGDQLGAIGDGLVGVELTGLTRTLHQNPGALVDQDAHRVSSRIFSAPSRRLSAATRSSPESLRISLPSSTLVPSSLTTSGTCRPTRSTASTIPVAITS